MGVPSGWLLLTLAIMVLLGVVIERWARPLNQPQLPCLATIGLSILIDAGADDMKPSSRRTWASTAIPFNFTVCSSASSTCSRGLRGGIGGGSEPVFHNTKIGRALRAVADDHQAAMSVGIPLKHGPWSGRRPVCRGGLALGFRLGWFRLPWRCSLPRVDLGFTSIPPLSK